MLPSRPPYHATGSRPACRTSASSSCSERTRTERRVLRARAVASARPRRARRSRCVRGPRRSRGRTCVPFDVVYSTRGRKRASSPSRWSVSSRKRPPGTSARRTRRRVSRSSAGSVEVAEGGEDVDHGVELGVEGQRAHVAADPAHRDAASRRVGTRPREHRLAQVVARDAEATLGERDGMAAVTAREVEHARAGREPEQGDDALHLGRGGLGREDVAIDLEVVRAEERLEPVGIALVTSPTGSRISRAIDAMSPAGRCSSAGSGGRRAGADEEGERGGRQQVGVASPNRRRPRRARREPEARRAAARASAPCRAARRAPTAPPGSSCVPSERATPSRAASHSTAKLQVIEAITTSTPFAWSSATPSRAPGAQVAASSASHSCFAVRPSYQRAISSRAAAMSASDESASKRRISESRPSGSASSSQTVGPRSSVPSRSKATTPRGRLGKVYSGWASESTRRAAPVRHRA